MKKFLSLFAFVLLISNTTTLGCSKIKNNFKNSSKKIFDDTKINFLSTADVHAGYSDSSSNKTINSLKNHLSLNNNRGVVISGDLSGNVANYLDIFHYYQMIKPIANHTLAGFGNHDADSRIGQYFLSKIVKKNAQRAANLLYYSNGAVGRSMPLYSWNWAGVHFVEVSLAPIDNDITKDQNNNPALSLKRLKDELQQNVDINSKMPIVLSFHYGYDEFSTSSKNPWWNNQQTEQFKQEILANYNVILMLTGHLHFHPEDKNTVFPVKVGNRIINDYLSGTSLYGGYSQISIDKVSKKISVIRYDATQKDLIAFQKSWNIPQI